MNFEQKINYQLNRFPLAKKIIKRSYQLIMWGISPRFKTNSDIFQISPDDKFEYFFGYYDKSPWDITGRYVLCMKAKNTWSDPDPKDKAAIILIDTQNGNSVRQLAETNAWNVQQGCMAQWLGPKYNEEIIYNDLNPKGYYCSYILNINTGQKKELPMPVYSVSNDGQTALSLDFSRLHSLRKGYGYSILPEETKGQAIPNKPCIWKIDIQTSKIEAIISYSDLVHFEPRVEMKNATHKVNHIMISPDGKRFMFLHRWFKGSRKYSRLITCNMNGTDMYNLSDDDMVSHCYWKNPHQIIAFENKHKTGAGYYLMNDKTPDYIHLWPEFDNDGHPSYSPNGKLIVTDSYPNKKRISQIKVLEEDNSIPIKELFVYSPFKYDNNTRCDLHPRWKRDGKAICFDGVFKGRRRLYITHIN